MVNYLFDIARALFAAVVILFFLMLPEVILGLIYPSFAPCWDPVRLSILLMLALSLSFVKNKKLLTCFLIVFGALQFVQIGVALFTGHYMSSFDLNSVAWQRFVLSVKESVWYHYLLVSGIVVVPYLVLEYIFARGILNPPSFKKGWIVMVLFLAGFSGYTISEKGRAEAQTACCYASYNTLNASVFYAAEKLPQKIKNRWPELSIGGLSAQAAEK